MTAPALRARPGPADYLTEVCQLLWPAPASAVLRSRRSARGETAERELLVLPGAGQPKLIVPAGRQAAAAAVRRYGEPASVKAKLATRVLAIMLAGGLRPVLGDRLVISVPDGCETIDTYLAGLAGRAGRPESVEVSLHVGAPRANRKPVLQLLTPAGDTIGFAKIGINSLTADLVRGEHVALKRLSEVKLTTLRPPTVLGYGSWSGLPVLVLDALPTWSGRVKLTDARLTAALVEVAGSAGLSSATLPDSGYLAGLLDRLARAGDGGGPDAEALRTLILRLADAADRTSLVFGCWHGDLTPWNLACTSAGLLVWDWERFAVGVPVGFDALHYWLQSQVVRRRCDPAAVAARCVGVAPELLAPFDVSPVQARLTALAYLSELSVRYLADRQAEAGARLGAVDHWLIPAIESGVGAL